MSRELSQVSVNLPALADGFGFQEEHELARRAARRFIAERCPLTEIRRWVDDPIGYDPALHREAAALGWLSSSELGSLHLGLLCEELGRALWPTPLFASLIALGLLEAADVGQRDRFESAIASGEMVATLAWSEPGGAWLPEQITTEASAVDGGFVLRGKKTHVLAGQTANLLIVPCREASGTTAPFLVELPAKGVTIEPEVCVDTTRRTARVLLDGVRVERSGRIDGDGPALLRRALLRGAALLACEMVGAAEAVLEKTRSYAIERQQFGRAIGSFQAVKHPIVDLMMGVELGRSLALGAASLLDTPGAESEQAARMAKAHAGDVLSYGVQKGVQLHGGFGFTWDCDVHFYFKRALWSRGTLGDSLHHRAELAKSLFG